jgi:putative phage-type endonuclease
VRIITCEQGTPEWKAARAGKVTASRISDVMAKGRGGAPSATREDYKAQIATEILTGAPAEDGFRSKDMDWGNEQEPYARAAYEAEQDTMVDTVGFVCHPTIDRAGCSPDGLVGWDGQGAPKKITQFKCPKTKTHMGYILADVVPADYQMQMLWEMANTGAQECDFVSFDPRLPEHLQLFIKPFPRDEVRIAAITAEVLAFLREVDELLANLARVRPAPVVEPEAPEGQPDSDPSEDLVPL